MLLLVLWFFLNSRLTLQSDFAPCAPIVVHSCTAKLAHPWTLICPPVCCYCWSLLINIRLILFLTSINFSAVKSLLVEYNPELKWRFESSLQDYSGWSILWAGTECSHRSLKVHGLAAVPGRLHRHREWCANDICWLQAQFFHQNQSVTPRKLQSPKIIP